MLQWFKKTALAGDGLLNELRSRLCIQEKNLTVFSEQLHAVGLVFEKVHIS